MTTQRKPLHTHVITLLFVLFQFIQFLPSSLVSSLTASAETSNSVTLFSDDKGSGNAKWSLSEDGKLITWDITVTQNESEAEAAPSVEVVVPANVGAPQVVSATPTGVFTPSGTSHTFTTPYSTTAQTLNLKFTTAVNDLTSPNLAFKIGASIQQKDSPAAASLQSVSIPNKLAQLEAERIAAEKAESERIAAEKAEAERIAAEEKAAQEEADKLAEEAAKQAAELEAEQREEDKDTQKEADESEQVADEEEKTEEAVEDEIEEDAVSEEDTDGEIESEVNAVVEASALEEKTEAQLTEKAVADDPKEEDAKEEPFAAVTMMQMDANVGILSTADAQNYFEATGTSTNDHYSVIGVYIDMADNVHLILDNDKNTANQTRFHSPMLNGQNAYNYSTNFNTYEQYWDEIGTSITLNISGTERTITGVRMFDFNLGPMTDLLQETNTLQMLNQADGFSIKGMTFTLDLDYSITKDVDPTTATIGDELIYTITVMNSGDLALSNVDVFDDSPPEVTILQVREVGGTWIDAETIDGRTQIAKNIYLAANGGSQTFEIRAYVNDDAVDAQELTNTATIGGAVAPKTDDATVTVEATNIDITKEIMGEDADLEGTFDFNYSITRPGELNTDHYYSPVNGIFNLGNGGTEHFNNLPTDALITMSEESGNYDVTVTVDGVEVTPNDDGEYLFDLSGLSSLSILVTNELTVPKEDYVVTKVWDGGPEENKNPVNLTLWRTTDGIEFSAVEFTPVIDPVEGPANEFTYTWSELPTEMADGTPITYYFTEVEVDGYTREYGAQEEFNGALYGVFNEVNQGMVTNIYQIPTDDIEATKTWLNGETVRPELWFQLRRSIDALEIDEAVDVMMLPAASDAEETVSVIFTDIELTDNDGNEYTFYVVEGTLVDGQFIPGTPDNFVKTGEGLDLTNTYESPMIDISARKVWNGGPSTDHVAVDLTLSRKISGEEFQLVDDNTPVVDPASGNNAEFNYTWSNLPATDDQGNPYEYTVAEPTVPENYESVVTPPGDDNDIWIMTNTYTSPHITIVGEKIWSNDTPEHRPESLTISLYRMIESGEPEYVTETTTSALDEWFYDFGEQDETDNDGNVYTYSIEETVPPNYNEDYASPYYVEDVLNLDVENTLVMGDLYILKTDMDGNPILDNPAEFKLTRIDPEVADPFTETLSTDAEGKLVFTDLLAGTYRLEETKAPLGFNLYPDDFIITIAKGQNGETIVSVEEVQVTEENPLMIKNRPSQSLPDTGSMGTTIFTVLGIALMGGAVYGLNKKKSKQS
ncbi:Cna B-type domain-containing protein [Alkalibacterium thalassium]|uniref:LPXTG-motif cell wall anchor domain-containing protein/conserved repeat domain-containing protein n=1 Tax=Alkalibacterium thalassium TaxID=426701 RepID=A0A1G8ZUD5_9LACT|nr:Cna B-type domain-containing protein [Alkalibacterium thalassium]SDK18663.1 LPXTG-motif cell wall anchor domain-containing protein/conserved repeat domain-containing protein [Alkalibacterium thalassium]